jgi:hypothetical protein
MKVFVPFQITWIALGEGLISFKQAIVLFELLFFSQRFIIPNRLI